MGGLNMLDLLAGYDRAIIIDAIQTEDGKAGQIYQLDVAALDATRHGTSIHEVNLATALELGKRLGMALPQKIYIFAIEASNVNTFSEECTFAVQSAVRRCAKMLITLLNGS